MKASRVTRRCMQQNRYRAVGRYHRGIKCSSQRQPGGGGEGGVITGAARAQHKGSRGMRESSLGRQGAHVAVRKRTSSKGASDAILIAAQASRGESGKRRGRGGGGGGQGGDLGRGRAASRPAVRHLNGITSKSCCKGVVTGHDACSFVLQIILLSRRSMASATRLVSWHNALLILLPCIDISKDHSDPNSNVERD